MAVFEQFAPQNNVNDDSITVLTLKVADGDAVESGQTLLVAETSKASFDVPAEAAGVVKWLVSEGEDVPNEKALCLIGASADELATAPGSAPALGSVAGSAGNGSVSNGAVAAAVAPSGATLSAVLELGPPAEMAGQRVVLTDWLCPAYAEVAEGQAVARVRCGDQAVEITAPRGGVVAFAGAPPMVLEAGAAVARLADSEAVLRATAGATEAAAPVAAGADSGGVDASVYSKTARTPVNGGVRVSAAAQGLIEQHGLGLDRFAGMGLVRSADVLRALGAAPAGSNVAAAGSNGSAGGSNAAGAPAARDGDWLVDGESFDERPMSRVKRMEAQVLAQSQRTVALSQVSVLVPSQGVFARCRETPALAGQMSSRIVFECARLLRKYPELNAGYRPKTVAVYDRVNVGYAIDVEKGLRVPVFHEADTMSLEEIHAKKMAYLAKYLEGELQLDDLAGGTFSITDLSEQGAWAIHPIVNQGQTAILGVGGEHSIGDGYAYPLMLAFDHRVSDGRTASAFLSDLKERLLGHEQAIMQTLEDTPGMSTVSCSVCYKSAAEVRAMKHFMVMTVDAAGRQKRVCTMCLGGW
ncbi:MAG: 2-oxo acid dehydrogenase subunit E2 [Planctomycetota bacterium]